MEIFWNSWDTLYVYKNRYFVTYFFYLTLHNLKNEMKRTSIKIETCFDLNVIFAQFIFVSVLFTININCLSIWSTRSMLVNRGRHIVITPHRDCW